MELEKKKEEFEKLHKQAVEQKENWTIMANKYAGAVEVLDMLLKELNTKKDE